MDASEDAAPRPIEWFAPAGFARDYWRAKHLANRDRATGQERVVLFGDSATEQWSSPLPTSIFLGQGLDTWVLEAPDGRKTNGSGFVEYVLAHLLPFFVWCWTYVFGERARVRAVAACVEVAMTHPRPAFTALSDALGGVVKMGIGGDRTRHARWRIEHGELDKAITPNLRVVLLQTGCNNLIYYEDVNQREDLVAARMLACAAAVEKRTPDTVHVVLMRLLPLKLPYLPADVAGRVNARLERLLSAAHGRGELLRTTSANFSRSVAVRGSADLEPDEALMPDGIHFHEASYAVWARDIEAAVREFL